MDSSGLSHDTRIHDEVFEPEASRVQGERSTVELRAHEYKGKKIDKNNFLSVSADEMLNFFYLTFVFTIFIVKKRR